MRTLFALSSLGLLVMVIVAAFLNINPEWKGFQYRYLDVALERTTDEVTRAALKETPVRIEQIYLPELNRIDRCVSCHLGVENPIMMDVPQPFRIHPGNYSKFHPISKFGCTICHEGQGRATSLKEAHANSEPFWERPLLKSDFVQSSCLKCHYGGISQSAHILFRGSPLLH